MDMKRKVMIMYMDDPEEEESDWLPMEADVLLITQHIKTVQFCSHLVDEFLSLTFYSE